MERSSCRSRRSEQFWRQHIDNCQASSLSQKDYCCTHGLALATFSYWKRKLQKHENPKSAIFYPLTIAGAGPEVNNRTGNEMSLTLCLSIFRLEISGECDADQLRKVIEVLESLSQ